MKTFVKINLNNVMATHEHFIQLQRMFGPKALAVASITKEGFKQHQHQKHELQKEGGLAGVIMPNKISIKNGEPVYDTNALGIPVNSLNAEKVTPQLIQGAFYAIRHHYQDFLLVPYKQNNVLVPAIGLGSAEEKVIVKVHAELKKLESEANQVIEIVLHPDPKKTVDFSETVLKLITHYLTENADYFTKLVAFKNAFAQLKTAYEKKNLTEENLLIEISRLLQNTLNTNGLSSIEVHSILQLQQKFFTIITAYKVIHPKVNIGNETLFNDAKAIAGDHTLASNAQEFETKLTLIASKLITMPKSSLAMTSSFFGIAAKEPELNTIEIRATYFAMKFSDKNYAAAFFNQLKNYGFQSIKINNNDTILFASHSEAINFLVDICGFNFHEISHAYREIAEAGYYFNEVLYSNVKGSTIFLPKVAEITADKEIVPGKGCIVLKFMINDTQHAKYRNEYIANTGFYLSSVLKNKYHVAFDRSNQELAVKVHKLNFNVFNLNDVNELLLELRALNLIHPDTSIEQLYEAFQIQQLAIGFKQETSNLLIDRFDPDFDAQSMRNESKIFIELDLDFRTTHGHFVNLQKILGNEALFLVPIALHEVELSPLQMEKGGLAGAMLPTLGNNHQYDTKTMGIPTISYTQNAPLTANHVQSAFEKIEKTTNKVLVVPYVKDVKTSGFVPAFGTGAGINATATNKIIKDKLAQLGEQVDIRICVFLNSDTQQPIINFSKTLETLLGKLPSYYPRPSENIDIHIVAIKALINTYSDEKRFTERNTGIHTIQKITALKLILSWAENCKALQQPQKSLPNPQIVQQKNNNNNNENDLIEFSDFISATSHVSDDDFFNANNNNLALPSIKQNSHLLFTEKNAAKSEQAPEKFPANFEVPDEWYCPLSLELMKDAVKFEYSTPAHKPDEPYVSTYDRDSIQDWINTRQGKALRDPLSNIEIENYKITPHVELQQEIDVYNKHCSSTQLNMKK